jgi:outer membrane protein TolC
VSSSHTSKSVRAGVRHSLIAAVATALSACAIHPQHFTDAEAVKAAQTGRAEMTAQQEAVTGPITLDEAMARAIHYNLDHRVKIMEEALAQKQLDLSNFDLLPKLTTAAG